MATLNKRILVSLTNHQRSVLERFGKASGQSLNAIIRDAVDTSIPLYEQLTPTLEGIKHASEQEKAEIEVNMLNLIGAIQPIADEGMKALIEGSTLKARDSLDVIQEVQAFIANRKQSRRGRGQNK